MPAIPAIVEEFKKVLAKGRWDGVSIDGAKPVPLTEDVKVGFANDAFWIKFKFKEESKDVVVEGRITLKGAESVLKNNQPLPGGRIAGKFVPLVTQSLPPKAKLKVAVIFKHGKGKSSYRMDGTLAST